MQLNDLRRDQNIKEPLSGSCKLTNRYGAVEFRSGFWMDAPRRCSWNIPPIHERQASAFDTASTARGLRSQLGIYIGMRQDLDLLGCYPQMLKSSTTMSPSKEVHATVPR